MGFIMQNEEDCSSASVQERLKQTFEAVARELIQGDASQYPNFSSILQLIDNKRITFKELVMINDVVPNLSLSGLSKLDTHF